MTYFLLPQTQSNHVYEEKTLPVTSSLEEYIATFPCDHTMVNLPLSELIQLYNIDGSSTFHVGTEVDGIFSLIVNVMHMDLSVLKRQQLNGTYIAKIDNSTSAESLQYLYKLCSSYKQVYLCKPNSDCLKSSVKYVVAIHFHKMPDLKNLVIPYYFRMKLSEINSIFGQTQLEYLRN
jgi:hypothetical protein